MGRSDQINQGINLPVCAGQCLRVNGVFLGWVAVHVGSGQAVSALFPSDDQVGDGTDEI